MYSEEGKRLKLLRELATAFGSERVLTDPEDVYVYSHHARFGARHGPQPFVVLRLRGDDDEKKLGKIADEYGLSVVKDHYMVRGSRSEGQDNVMLIVDSEEYINIESLTERLLELRLAHAMGRQALKKATSFPQWFVASLKCKAGFQTDERPDSDNGFCIVQPFFDGVETFSSKGRLLLSKGLFSGELKATDKLVKSMYSCTACGQCFDQMAPDGFEINNAIVRARYEVVKMGAGPGQCKALSKAIEEEGNPMGMPAEDRPLWFEELAQKFPFRGEDILYWTGCSTAYRLPHVIESTANVMKAAKFGFGLLGAEEGCCGLILYLLGLWEEATRNGSKIIKKLGDLGVKQMVTSCAGCYFAFSKAYEKLGLRVPFQVLHTSQLIESLITVGSLHLREKECNYVWHDPCDLGRHCRVFEPPRRVLRSIPKLKLVEPPLNREHTICCGAGGGLWMYDKDLAEKMAVKKLKEHLIPLVVDGVVTGCPNCILSLKYASAKMDLNVFDLSEIVEKCL